MANEDPLEPTLIEAARTLKTALGQVCGTNVEQADTGELIHIEEVLSIANDAAKQAISVRRRMRAKRSSASREFTDARGTDWKVFAVVPTVHRGRAGVQDRFRDGWLSFDSAAETRRVAPIPPAWEQMSNEELLALAERNGIVSRRRRT